MPLYGFRLCVPHSLAVYSYSFGVWRTKIGINLCVAVVVEICQLEHCGG